MDLRGDKEVVLTAVSKAAQEGFAVAGIKLPFNLPTLGRMTVLQQVVRCVQESYSLKQHMHRFEMQQRTTGVEKNWFIKITSKVNMNPRRAPGTPRSGSGTPRSAGGPASSLLESCSPR